MLAAENSEDILLGPGKRLAILTYLALAHNGSATREMLAELFWRGSPFPAALHSLRQALYRLRHVDGQPLVIADGERVELAAHIQFDCLLGESAVEAGDYERGWQLLRGVFLPGFSIRESREYERWLEANRQRFRASWVSASIALIEETLARGNAHAALQRAEELAANEPLLDSAALLEMKALAQLQRHATALSRHKAYVSLLRQELDEWPGEEVLEYAKRLEAIANRAAERATPLVGRSEEWAALESAWQSALRGSGTTVLVKSRPGLGKSRLLSDFVGRVRSAEGRVFSARCYEIEHDIPYEAISDALSGLIDYPELERLDASWLSRVAMILPELRERYPNLGTEDGAGTLGGRISLHKAICRCLIAVAQTGPVLLAIDDLEWADRYSLELLHTVCRRITGEKVLVIGSLGEDQVTDRSALFARTLCSERLARCISLEPLMVGDVRTYMEQLADFDSAENAESLSLLVHRHCRGNPLMLTSLLEALERDRTLLAFGGRWEIASDDLRGRIGAVADAVSSQLDVGIPFRSGTVS